MDETWIHYYTPESKRSSAEWTAAGESRPKRPKIQKSASKVMASVFWDVHDPDQYSYTMKPDENALFQYTHVVIVGKFEELILLYLVRYDKNASEDRIEI